MTDIKTMLYNHCEEIRDELVKLYNGLDLTDDEREEAEENGEATDIYSYFDDCLDIEYRIGSDGAFRSVLLMIACGGPNIYVDTGDRAVKGYWGTDHATVYLPSEVCDEIDAIFEDLYACTR